MIKRIARKISRIANRIAHPHLLASLSQPHPLPLPPGIASREIALDMFRTVSIDGAPAQEIRTYAEADCNRFLYTLDLVKPEAEKLLEIGANPYFTSVLLKEYRNADLEFTNYFGPGELHQTQNITYTTPQGEVRSSDMQYLNLNIEDTLIENKENHYDHIVFCEVLEHMTNDPLFVLESINSMLKTDGSLILTTPNVARLDNVAALIAGANMYDPYSGYGPYGRHNREYTAHELNWLLEYTGFKVEVLYTSDVSPSHAAGYCDLSKVSPLLEFRKPDLGQYIFIRATKVRDLPTKLKRPAWLYRSLSADDLVNLQLTDPPQSI